ncbi:hypothetical protein [Capybara microvirus Cap3_SP_469]|nr:hypothetical protein [Capybara microvirus Cap3_SP_469]
MSKKKVVNDLSYHYHVNTCDEGINEVKCACKLYNEGKYTFEELILFLNTIKTQIDDDLDDLILEVICDRIEKIESEVYKN